MIDLAFLTFLVFLILVALFVVFVWPQLSTTLQQRESDLRTAIEQAEATLEASKATLREAQSALQKMPDEVRSKRETAQVDAERLLVRLRIEARQEAEAIRERAVAEISLAESRARDLIWQRATDQAMERARQLIVTMLTPSQKSRLVDEAIVSLPIPAATSNSGVA